MRLLIDAGTVQFRVAGVAKAKQDFKDKDRQAVTRDGEPVWSLRLDAKILLRTVPYMIGRRGV